MLNSMATSGGHYYSSPEDLILFPWLEDELSRLREKGDGKDSEKVRVGRSKNQLKGEHDAHEDE